MNHGTMHRRSLLAGFGVAALALALDGPGAFAASGPAAVSSVGVDVAPLYAKGLGPYADHVRAVMTKSLRDAFADRLGRGGPRLVVRIDSISLRLLPDGSRSLGGGGASNNDYMEGEGVLVGPRGEALGRYPQLSASPASNGEPWYLPGTEERQLVALSNHFAGWMRRNFD